MSPTFRSIRRGTTPRCVTFPHLGASTEEAEENCAIMVADQIRGFLEDGHIHNSVNFPEVRLARTTEHRLVCAAAGSAAIDDRVSDALRRAGLSIQAMANVSRGGLAYLVADLNGAPADALLRDVRSIEGVLMARSV